MPNMPFRDIVQDAFARRYGVGAFNVFDELSMESVLRAAQELRSPVIVQTSVKTVRSIGTGVLAALWRELTRDLDVPVCLHLDHCPDRTVLSDCLRAGWGSVLFDASALPLDENRRQTIEVVAEARRYGAGVEGEIEGIRGVEDGVGTDADAAPTPLADAVDFVRATGVDCFAPSIGNAHGLYAEAPRLDAQRVSDLVAAVPVPIALHGGTGLDDPQLQDLVARGCAKVNVSTALKMAYMQASLAFLRRAEADGSWDPPSLFRHVGAAVREEVIRYLRVLGSAGRA